MIAIATVSLDDMLQSIHLYKHPTVRHRSIGVPT
nr:MAG TPA: hypothetical protein [Caudoviricetes sp.]